MVELKVAGIGGATLESGADVSTWVLTEIQHTIAEGEGEGEVCEETNDDSLAGFNEAVDCREAII